MTLNYKIGINSDLFIEFYQENIVDLGFRVKWNEMRSEVAYPVSQYQAVVRREYSQTGI